MPAETDVRRAIRAALRSVAKRYSSVLQPRSANTVSARRSFLLAPLGVYAPDAASGTVAADGLGGTGAALSEAANEAPIVLAQATTTKPTARLSVTKLTRANFRFNASASRAGAGQIIEFLFNFGDGISLRSTSSLAEHQYLLPGTYNVILTVKDSAQSSAQTSATAQVDQIDPPPVNTGKIEIIRGKLSAGKFATIQQAVRAAQPGDVVNVPAAKYYRADAVALITVPYLTIRCAEAGARAELYSNGVVVEDKGIFVTRANGVRIQGFRFYGASSSANNGAGIRVEGSDQIVEDCLFMHCNNGIMGGKYPGALTVRGCHFYRCGDSEGRAHSIYVAPDTFIFTENVSEEVWVGHLLKSRAKVSLITRNRFLGSRASYEVEFPSGGKALVDNNLIWQGQISGGNSAIISWGAELASPALPLPDDPNHELVVTNNTIVDDRPGDLLVVKNYPINKTPVARNNRVVGKPRTPSWYVAANNQTFANRAEFAAQYPAIILPQRPAVPAPRMLNVVRGSDGAVAPATWTGAPKLTWLAVPGSKLSDLPYPGLKTSPAQQTVEAWSGGCWDPERKQLIVSGGGHGNSDNSVFAFSLATLKWSFLLNQSPSSAHWVASDFPDGKGMKERNNYTGWNNQTIYYKDGRPTAKHYYNAFHWIPSIKRVLGWRNNYLVVFDPAKRAFEHTLGSTLYGPLPGGQSYPKHPKQWGSGSPFAVVDPKTGRYVLMISEYSYGAVFDPVAKTWGTIFAMPKGSYISHGTMLSNSREVAIFPSATNFSMGPTKVILVNLDTFAGRTVDINPPIDQKVNFYYSGTVALADGDVVVWSNEGQLYRLTPGDWRYRQMTIAGAPPPRPLFGMMGRMRYIPDINGLMMQSQAATEVYVMLL